jgi:putative PEP-CTERM system TPR-repeat lipoprotein
MIKSPLIKKSLTTVSILLLSFTVESATYDLLEEQKTDQLLLPDTQSGSSFFDVDLTQQQAINDQKKNYLEILELIKNKKLKEAEIKINALLKNNPKEPEFYNLQGLLAATNKQQELAIKSYQKAINLDPKNLKAHLAIAKVSLDTGDIKRAKEYAYKALSINNKTPYAFYILADIALKQNQPLAAEKALLTAKSRNQGNAKLEVAIANNLGKFYITQKQTHKILPLAKDIVTRYPKESSALSLLANAQLINHQKKEAEKTLKKLIIQDKQDIPGRLLLISLLTDQPKKEKEALKLLDEISSIAPDNLQVLSQKAAYLIKLKHYQAARNVATKIDKLNPKLGFIYLVDGEIYLHEKKLDSALSAFQHAYKIKPTEKILNVITDIMVSKGKQSEAINFLNKELKKNHQNLAGHFKLATLYQQQNNLIEAEKHYKVVLSVMPDNAIVLNNLAWIYHQQNNPKALKLAEQAYKLAPNSAAIADTYGVILTKLGNLQQGIDVLEKASKLAPMAYDIQYHLAEAYAANGNKKQAIDILNQVLKTEQIFSEKNAAIALLKKLEDN